MQQLFFVKPAQVEWRSYSKPTITDPKQAIVRPLAVSLCDLDCAIIAGQVPLQGPFVLGHEVAAEVVEVGDGVAQFAPGDRVIVPFQISCGSCARCQSGRTGSCREVPKLSAFGLAPLSGIEYGGGLSDAMLVPFADAMLLSIPPGVSPLATAAVSDNASDGYRTVAGPLAEMPGAPVLVIGGGAPSIGLYAVACARALGSSDIVYLDYKQDRLRQAESLGARVIDERPAPGLRPGRFAITVDASAQEPGLRLALACTDADGVCTSVGIYYRDVALPLLDMYTRGVRFVTGRVNARAHAPGLLKLISAGKLDIGAVASRVVDWEQAAEAVVEGTTKLHVARKEASEPVAAA